MSAYTRGTSILSASLRQRIGNASPPKQSMLSRLFSRLAPPLPTATIDNPSKVTVNPMGGLKSSVFTNVSHVSVTGGKMWVPQWAQQSHVYDNPARVTVRLTDGTSKTFTSVQEVTADGGSVTVMGADAIPQVSPEGATYDTDYATVLAVQRQLLARNLYLPPNKLDGVYGPATAKGVRAVQASLHVDQTGMIDSTVLLALGVPVPAHADAVPPPSSGRPTPGWNQPMPGAMGPSVTPPSDGGLVSSDSGFVAVMKRPIWEGAPFAAWQVGLGGVALVGIGVGVYTALRR